MDLYEEVKENVIGQIKIIGTYLKIYIIWV